MVVVSSLVVVVVTSTNTIPWSLVVVVPIVIVVTVVGVVGVIVGIVGVVGVVVGGGVVLSAGFCCTHHLIHEAARHAHSFIKFLGIG